MKSLYALIWLVTLYNVCLGMNDFSLGIIMPKAIENGSTETIINHITENGFAIVASQLYKIDVEGITQHQEYAYCASTLFHKKLMIPLLVHKKNAFQEFNNFINKSYPCHPVIRTSYGKIVWVPDVLACSSQEDLKQEIKNFFPEYYYGAVNSQGNILENHEKDDNFSSYM